MKQLRLCLIGAGLASLAAPALASSAQIVSAYEAGRCIVQSDRAAARDLIAALPLNGTTADLSGLAGTRAAHCASRAAGASAMLMRGAIAQELYRVDFRGFEREPRETTRFVNFAIPVQTSPAGDRSTELYRWGDCVVRNNPGGTEQLLRSEIGSPEEAEAIAGLRDHMFACIGADDRLEVRPWEVRSVFAQSAYHSLHRYWTGQLHGTRRGSD